MAREPSTFQPAGLIGLKNTSEGELSTEIGWLVTLPQFQRTHVTTHAIGLLLLWAFDELGMDRVQWYTDERNERSLRAAERMGFVRSEARSRREQELSAFDLSLGGIVLPNGGRPRKHGRKQEMQMIELAVDRNR